MPAHLPAVSFVFALIASPCLLACLFGAFVDYPLLPRYHLLRNSRFTRVLQSELQKIFFSCPSFRWSCLQFCSSSFASSSPDNLQGLFVCLFVFLFFFSRFFPQRDFHRTAQGCVITIMSGATLATGPRVPKVDKSEQHGKKFEERAADGAGLGGVMGSLRVIELQLVAFIVVFSASGLVPVVDLVFPIFITVYCFLLSYFVFRNYGNPDALQLFKGNRAFQFYVILGTVIGLFLPLAYVLGGFARGDQEAVRAATPHLFLLSFQVLSENIIRGLNIFSLPVRALLPILYNMRRLFTLINWITATFFGNKLSPDIPYQVSNYTLSHFHKHQRSLNSNHHITFLILNARISWLLVISSLWIGNFFLWFSFVRVFALWYHSSYCCKMAMYY